MKRIRQIFSMLLVALLVTSLVTHSGVSASSSKPSIKAVTTQVTSPIYKSKSTLSSKVTTVKKGATVTIVSEASGWTYVKYGSKEGYMPVKAVTPANNALATSKSVTLYTSTSTRSKKVKTLSSNTEVVVLKVYRSWALIKYGNTSGWVAKNSLKARVKIPVVKNATVQSDTSVLYASKSTKAKKISTLKFGNSVTILSEANGWSYVQYGQKKGYMVSKHFVPEVTKFKTTRASTLYYETSTKSEKVTTVPSNMTVTVLKVYRSWSLVQYGTKTGWMAKRYLALDVSEASPLPTVPGEPEVPVVPPTEPTVPTEPEVPVVPPTEPTVPTDPNAEFKQLVKDSYEKVSQSNDWQDQSAEVLRLVNVYRVENGVKPLIDKQNLVEFAVFRWDDMKTNDYVSHNSPTYGDFYEMANKVGIGNDRLSTENIAWNQMTPSQVVETWKNSLYHNETMLDPNYTHSGIIWKDGLAVHVFEENF